VSEPWWAFDGAGSRERLAESFLNEGQFLLVALRSDGTFAFANDAVRQILGHEPSYLVGRNVVDLLHPDDVERAILQLTSAEGSSVLTGITRFRVRHRDGSWQPIELFGAPVSDGVEQYIGIYGRSGIHQVVVEDILSLLLRGHPRDQVLSPVCDVIQWHGAGSHLAISWEDDDGFHQVSTGIGDELGGGDGRAGTPWERCRLAPQPSGIQGDCSGLPEDLADAASKAGVSMYWIEPIAWSNRHRPALVTVWSVGGSRVPTLHSYGMGVARDMVELILRWTEQVAEMATAARVDSLTGLANRRAFFVALSEIDGGGAVLYCDLDHFKPVNDTYGHGAGDQLLQEVATRIEGCARAGDLVARLGGDEFAVICAGSA